MARDVVRATCRLPRPDPGGARSARRGARSARAAGERHPGVLRVGQQRVPAARVLLRVGSHLPPGSAPAGAARRGRRCDRSPGTGRRRGGHRPLERSGHADPHEDGTGTRRRLHARDQAVPGDAVVVVCDRPSRRTGRSAARRHQHRARWSRGRRAPRCASRGRPRLVHRQHRGGEADRGCLCSRRQARQPRAWRQVGRDPPRRSRPRSSDPHGGERGHVLQRRSLLGARPACSSHGVVTTRSSSG